MEGALRYGNIFARIAVFDLDLPTIAMVGAQMLENQAFRALCTGNPSKSLSFTTRGILIGHLKIPTDRRVYILVTRWRTFASYRYPGC